MNTVAHIVIASAILARREQPRRNWVVILAALVPDFSMFVFFAWSRIMGWSGPETWDVKYWTEPWQTFGAISNSFVLAAAILTVALWRKWQLLAIACGAILLHLALDFPLHADDAHRHFWPVTDWRFFSPVSYWDPRANGLLGAVLETGFVTAACIALLIRFKKIWWRALIASIAVAQVLLLAGAVMFADRIADGSAATETPHLQDHQNLQL